MNYIEAFDLYGIEHKWYKIHKTEYGRKMQNC